VGVLQMFLTYRKNLLRSPAVKINIDKRRCRRNNHHSR
jgi:hypothetical protein